MAGYSGTPLPRKLGITPGARVALIGAPEGFEATLGELPERVRVVRPGRGHADVAIFFTTERRALKRRIAALEQRIEPDGALWVAWPKRAARVPTDMSEDIVRDVALPRGLVDNKVCAIDETWSGLRLVVRRELRAGLARSDS